MADEQLQQFVAGSQIQGSRNYQEDDYGVSAYNENGAHNGLLLVLADGMGGHVGGAHASKRAVETFIETYHADDLDIEQRLQNSLALANQALQADIEEDPDLDGMGATLVSAVINNGTLRWISVGDSPLLHYRNGVVKQLNEDHSMAPVIDALIELGRISQEEALQDSRRNQLRSVVNGEEITMIDLPEQDFMLLDGDIVILASDGLQTLSNNEIADILQHNINQSPAEIVDVMLNAVEKKQKNNQDNASILICKYQEAINSYLDADSTSTEAITEKKNI